MTPKRTSAQVVEKSVNVISNSPSQDYTHPDVRTSLNYDMTPGFKPFTTSNSFHSFTSYLLFVCKYLAFYLSFHCFRNCIYAECFIHELELENDRGTVEMSFFFLFIAHFYNLIIIIIIMFIKEDLQKLIVSTFYKKWCVVKHIKKI